MKYAIYPFREMRITQRHDQGNHAPHWKNVTNHSDKPWDEACKDEGRSYFEPQNDYKVVEIKGLNTTSTTNAVRLETVNKVKIPYQDEPVILELTLTHMEEEDIKKLKVGQIIKKGEKILLEGKDGQATGYHFHCTANIGKYYGLLKNNNGKWCFTYEKSLLPDEAFYLDKNITTIYNASNYEFKEVPKIIYTVGTYKTLNNMNVRIGASINNPIKKVKDLTEDGKKNATSTDLEANAVYKKGTLFTAKEIIINGKTIWAKTPSGYVCIEDENFVYCEKQ